MQRITALSILLLAIGLASSAAYADPFHRGRPFGGRFYSHNRHPGFSFYFGVPWYPRPYFSYPYYYPYYPPVVTVPTEPPVYIERDPPQTQQPLAPGYWYYCSNPEGYYPYVKECPYGWRQVDPIPPR